MRLGIKGGGGYGEKGEWRPFRTLCFSAVDAACAANQYISTTVIRLHLPVP